MNRLNIATIMPVLQEEWQCHQARRHDHKSSHLARTNICGGPQHQHWQGQQNNYTPQAGQHNYNKPAPYNKFGKRPNNFNSNSNQKPDYNKPSRSKGPNWDHNWQNHLNKKQAKQFLMDRVKSLEMNHVQPKPDKKGKGKAVKTANLLARIDEEIPLIVIMKEFLSLLKVIKLIKLYRWTLMMKLSH